MVSDRRIARSVAPVVGALLLLTASAPVAAEQGRTQNCPPGAPRDVEGYCIGASPRSSSTPAQTPRHTSGQRTAEPQVQPQTSPTWSAPTTYAPRTVYQPTPAATFYGTPQPPAVRRASPWPWVVLGAGAAVALAGVALDVVALVDSQRDSPFDQVSEIAPWADRVEAEALAGDVLLFVGAAIAVGGLVWGLLDLRRRRTLAATVARWFGPRLGDRPALL